MMKFQDCIRDTLPWFMLEMLHAGQQAFVLIDETGRITDMTAQAKYLLKQNTMDDIGEVLTGSGWRKLKFALQTHQPATAEEDIDGDFYQMDIRPIEGGALLHFTPLQLKPPSLPMPMQEKMMNALELILIGARGFPAAADGQRQALDNIERNALRILRSLRHASLLDKGAEIPLDLKEDDISKFCQHLCARTQQVCWERKMNVQIICDTPKKGLFTAYDKELLTRAILGLLTNAAKASSQVRLKLAGDEHNVRITVANEGNGIAAGDLERFYNGWAYPMDEDGWLERKMEKQVFSTGLPVVRRVAGWHGGALLFDADMDGVCFRLVFPRITSENMEGCKASQPVMVEEGADVIAQELSVL